LKKHLTHNLNDNFQADRRRVLQTTLKVSPKKQQNHIKLKPFSKPLLYYNTKKRNTQLLIIKNKRLYDKTTAYFNHLAKNCLCFFFSNHFYVLFHKIKELFNYSFVFFISLTHIDKVSSPLREVAESKTYGLYFTAPVINPSI
jgi:hypothetical protein